MREVYVTQGDVARISAWLGNGVDVFYQFRVSSNPEYFQQDDDPEWKYWVFRVDGSRRVLRQTEKGDCCFLSSAGCLLPLAVRTLVCRLFPFQYSAWGLDARLATDCPVELLLAGENLLDALGMNRQQAEQWRAQLYAEIQQEEHAPCTSA